MIFKEMTDNQQRVFIDTIQIHEAFVAAKRTTILSTNHRIKSFTTVHWDAQTARAPYAGQL